VRITADTNILLRMIVNDDPGQAAAARQILGKATLVAVTLPTLCEIVWVLRKTYQRSQRDVAETLATILSIDKIVLDRSAVEAGIRMVEAGGDFADGAIAYEGRQLGGDVFVTFDKRTAALISKAGHQANLLTSKS
jgi:predicted nucleic-acid-binding protein